MDNTAFILMFVLFGMPIIGAIYFEIVNDINSIIHDIKNGISAYMTILHNSITMLVFITTIIFVIFNNA